MQILIVTPPAADRRSGNCITARRWARLLRESGHQVRIAAEFRSQKCDALIALHAQKSAGSIQRFHNSNPERRLILALTGTDLYRDIQQSATARHSMQIADRLVLLQECGRMELTEALQDKARVIHQSAIAPQKVVPRLRNAFEVCVIGHLRPVKDPFRTAFAVRNLPAESRIRVSHYGRAMSDTMRETALQESQRNKRYTWHGDKPHWQVMQRLARSRLLVLSSKMEGGANVIGESIVAGTPVIASRISGSIGLLGENYEGFFETGNTQQLRSLLIKAKTDTGFYQRLTAQCRSLKPIFKPARERKLLNKLVCETA